MPQDDLFQWTAARVVLFVHNEMVRQLMTPSGGQTNQTLHTLCRIPCNDKFAYRCDNRPNTPLSQQGAVGDVCDRWLIDLDGTCWGERQSSFAHSLHALPFNTMTLPTDGMADPRHPLSNGEQLERFCLPMISGSGTLMASFGAWTSWWSLLCCSRTPTSWREI